MTTSREKHPHTAHEPSAARICYRYHPFFGHEVRLVRRFRRVATDSLIVALADGLQLAVPAWMLDPIACEPLRVTATPHISLTALRQLRTLLDAQTLGANLALPYAQAKPLCGGHHARPEDSAPATPTL